MSKGPYKTISEDLPLIPYLASRKLKFYIRGTQIQHCFAEQNFARKQMIKINVMYANLPISHKLAPFAWLQTLESQTGAFGSRSRSKAEG